MEKETAGFKVVVIGVGLIGPGVATCSALAGYETILVGRTTKKADNGILKAKSNIEQLLENNVVTKEQSDRAARLLSPAVGISRVTKDASLIIEAITEDVEAKVDLFRELDRNIAEYTIVTSTTSGIRVNDITCGLEHAAKMASTHFWFPSHLIPLVEIVKGERTEESVLLKLRDIMLSWGKAPVILRRDMPGQLANRIQQAVIREAISIVESGAATAEDVDTAIKMGFGIRLPAWGPLEHLDAVGLDLALSVQRSVVPSLDNRIEPSVYLSRLVDSGSVGHKSGTGFYDWGKKNMESLASTRDQFIMKALRLLRE